MTIRKAQPEDLDAVLGLCRFCVDDMLAGGIRQWDACYPGPQIFASDIAGGSLWLAFHEGRLVGSLTLNTEQNVEYLTVPWRFGGDRIALLHRLMVLPACHRQGVARLLVRFAEQQAAGRGFSSMRLDTFT
ncbi:MAG: GNAT family N-acetyltransferase, partial [Clostridia bacterium]|nr:GNAT family N-acetyltransferase [Clostridia bacterium]